jgi:hypothetical protein
MSHIVNNVVGPVKVFTDILWVGKAAFMDQPRVANSIPWYSLWWRSCNKYYEVREAKNMADAVFLCGPKRFPESRGLTKRSAKPEL